MPLMPVIAHVASRNGLGHILKAHEYRCHYGLKFGVGFREYDNAIRCGDERGLIII